MFIQDYEVFSNGLKIIFDDKSDDFFPNIWLRDHSRDDLNWDSRSYQRKTFTASLDPQLFIKKATIDHKGKNIAILWSDMMESTNYKFEFLYAHSLHYQSKLKTEDTWDKNQIDKTIFVDYKDIDTEVGFKNLLDKIKFFGFSVISNCPPNLVSVEKIANKIGYVRNSIFGGLWEFESDKNMADSAYTQEELRPHTDGSYCHDAPGLQLLLCCKYEATGGESILVDGFKIAEKIKKEDYDLYDILTKIDVPGNYVGDGVFLEASRPIFKINSNQELIQVTFNNYDRSPFRIENDLMIKFYEGIRKFDKFANNKNLQWRHILKPGELLIFNNWRILHGRGEFNGSRKMAGCYINKEDFDSICKMKNI